MRGSEARGLKSLKFVIRDGRHILIMEAIPGDPVACADSFAKASWKSLKKHVWLCLVDRLFWTEIYVPQKLNCPVLFSALLSVGWSGITGDNVAAG